MVHIGFKAGSKISSALSITAVRNQIVHDPNSSEENMCDLSDAQWIDNFYDRIMKQGDPLAMYQKATKPRPVAKPKPLHQSPQAQYTYSVQPVYSKKEAKKATGWVVLLIVIVLVGLFFVLKHLVN